MAAFGTHSPLLTWALNRIMQLEDRGVTKGSFDTTKPKPVWTGLVAREEVEALQAIADAARAVAEYADKWEPPPNQLVMYLADKVVVLDEFMETVK